MPRPRLVIPQLLAAGADWVLAGTVLYLMLPQAIDVRWLVFVSIFLLAQLVGYASQVPGGLGIFESTILLLMAPPNPAPLVGALVLYRLVYYVLPLTDRGGAPAGPRDRRPAREAVALRPRPSAGCCRRWRRRRSRSAPWWPARCCSSPAPCRSSPTASS